MEFKKIDFPSSRVGTHDLGKIGKGKHHVATILELNVTESRSAIRELRRCGKSISFISWLVKKISETLEEHEEVRGYLKGRNKKIVFKDVSMSVMVEKSVSGTMVPIPLLIENINHISVEEIYEKIESAKSLKINSEEDFVIEGSISKRLMSLYYKLPQFIRLLAIKSILKKPFKSHKMMGDAIFTSSGMTGRIPGWAIVKSYHNVAFVLGTIVKKPWVVNNQIMIQEIAHLTLLIDHDVVDGVAMAKFISNLARKIEKFDM